MNPNIPMKYAVHMAWIIICKSRKSSDKICYIYGDSEFCKETGIYWCTVCAAVCLCLLSRPWALQKLIDMLLGADCLAPKQLRIRWSTYERHLANTIERLMLGGYADFCYHYTQTPLVQFVVDLLEQIEPMELEHYCSQSTCLFSPSRSLNTVCQFIR